MKATSQGLRTIAVLSLEACASQPTPVAKGGPRGLRADLHDIAVDARGDKEGIIVSIVTRDASLVQELQRRAAHDLESGAKMREQTAKDR
jgi:hypothetical protein